MSWTLAGITIHPGDEEYSTELESLYAIQTPLDATVDTINWFATHSERLNLSFILFESESSGSGLSTIKASATAGSSVALVDDASATTNWYIMNIGSARKIAVNESSAVWKVNLTLIAA